MDATIVSLIVGGLAFILPKFGITVGGDALTQTVSTLVVIVSGLVAYWHTKTSKNLTIAGFKK